MDDYMFNNFLNSDIQLENIPIPPSEDRLGNFSNLSSITCTLQDSDNKEKNEGSSIQKNSSEALKNLNEPEIFLGDVCKEENNFPVSGKITQDILETECNQSNFDNPNVAKILKTEKLAVQTKLMIKRRLHAVAKQSQLSLKKEKKKENMFISVEQSKDLKRQEVQYSLVESENNLPRYSDSNRSRYSSIQAETQVDINAKEDINLQQAELRETSYNAFSLQKNDEKKLGRLKLEVDSSQDNSSKIIGRDFFIKPLISNVRRKFYSVIERTTIAEPSIKYSFSPYVQQISNSMINLGAKRFLDPDSSFGFVEEELKSNLEQKYSETSTYLKEITGGYASKFSSQEIGNEISLNDQISNTIGLCKIRELKSERNSKVNCNESTSSNIEIPKQIDSEIELENSVFINDGSKDKNRTFNNSFIDLSKNNSTLNTDSSEFNYMDFLKCAQIDDDRCDISIVNFNVSGKLNQDIFQKSSTNCESNELRSSPELKPSLKEEKTNERILKFKKLKYMYNKWDTLSDDTNSYTFSPSNSHSDCEVDINKKKYTYKLKKKQKKNKKFLSKHTFKEKYYDEKHNKVKLCIEKKPDSNLVYEWFLKHQEISSLNDNSDDLCQMNSNLSQTSDSLFRENNDLCPETKVESQKASVFDLAEKYSPTLTSSDDEKFLKTECVFKESSKFTESSSGLHSKDFPRQEINKTTQLKKSNVGSVSIDMFSNEFDEFVEGEELKNQINRDISEIFNKNTFGNVPFHEVRSSNVNVNKFSPLIISDNNLNMDSNLIPMDTSKVKTIPPINITEEIQKKCKSEATTENAFIKNKDIVHNLVLPDKKHSNNSSLEAQEILINTESNITVEIPEVNNLDEKKSSQLDCKGINYEKLSNKNSSNKISYNVESNDSFAEKSEIIEKRRESDLCKTKSNDVQNTTKSNQINLPKITKLFVSKISTMHLNNSESTSTIDPSNEISSTEEKKKFLFDSEFEENTNSEILKKFPKLKSHTNFFTIENEIYEKGFQSLEFCISKDIDNHQNEPSFEGLQKFADADDKLIESNIKNKNILSRQLSLDIFERKDQSKDISNFTEKTKVSDINVQCSKSEKKSKLGLFTVNDKYINSTNSDFDKNNSGNSVDNNYSILIPHDSSAYRFPSGADIQNSISSNENSNKIPNFSPPKIINNSEIYNQKSDLIISDEKNISKKETSKSDLHFYNETNCQPIPVNTNKFTSVSGESDTSQMANENSDTNSSSTEEGESKSDYSNDGIEVNEPLFDSNLKGLISNLNKNRIQKSNQLKKISSDEDLNSNKSLKVSNDRSNENIDSENHSKCTTSSYSTDYSDFNKDSDYQKRVDEYIKKISRHSPLKRSLEERYSREYHNKNSCYFPRYDKRNRSITERKPYEVRRSPEYYRKTSRHYSSPLNRKRRRSRSPYTNRYFSRRKSRRYSSSPSPDRSNFSLRHEFSRRSRSPDSKNNRKSSQFVEDVINSMSTTVSIANFSNSPLGDSSHGIWEPVEKYRESYPYYNSSVEKTLCRIPLGNEKSSRSDERYSLFNNELQPLYYQYNNYNADFMNSTIQNYSQPVLPHTSTEHPKILQMGNVLQVVPAESFSSTPKEHSHLDRSQEKINVESTVFQVGNILQVIPAENLSPLTTNLNQQNSVDNSNVDDTANIQEPSAELIDPNDNDMRQKKLKMKLEHQKPKVSKRMLMEIKFKKQSTLNLSTTNNMKPKKIICDSTSEPEKGILIFPPNSITESPIQVQSDRKSVSFADGVIPGEGTSPSGGEEHRLSPPPLKKIKRKKKKNIKLLKTVVSQGNKTTLPPPPGNPPWENFYMFQHSDGRIIIEPPLSILYSVGVAANQITEISVE